ncbi:MAG: DUF488 family protein, partial [Candidatus Dormibacteraceae bacterium]
MHLGRLGPTPERPLRIFTIGHSDRQLSQFMELLVGNQVWLVADVRSSPTSKRLPHFEKEALAGELRRIGIQYAHLPGLGGRRRPDAQSVNQGWRNASFRGYADYMQTDAFRSSLAELLELAAGRRTAIMCAEAVPWRCHRSLVADALLAAGIDVFDIIGRQPPRPHRLTPFGLVQGSEVTYPGAGWP